MDYSGFNLNISCIEMPVTVGSTMDIKVLHFYPNTKGFSFSTILSLIQGKNLLTLV